MSMCKAPPAGVHVNGDVDAESALSSSVLTSSPRSPLPSSGQGSVWRHLQAKVDASQATALLAGFSFMTGFIDAISLVEMFVWCGFQTGNFVQLAVASSRMFSAIPWNNHSEGLFLHSDQQALTSFLAFNVGACMSRLGDKIGPLTRMWLVLGTTIQALFTLAASITMWKSQQQTVEAWSNPFSFACIAMLSMSLGLQGAMSKKLNTPFGTTIVLTTVWCELVTEPKLFVRRRIPSRDHKFLAASCIFMGAIMGCSLVRQVGSVVAIGVGTGIRVLIALGWMFVPADMRFITT